MGETSVTIKSGKRFDDTWTVFRGTSESIKADIIEHFGMDPAQAVLSTHSVVLNATRIAQGESPVPAQLGGTVVSEKPTPTIRADDPWSIAAQSPQASSPLTDNASQEDETRTYILDLIEAQTNIEGLKKLWAENRELFKDQLAMARYKEKGKALLGG